MATLARPARTLFNSSSKYMAAISMRSSADANVAFTSIIIVVILSFMGSKVQIREENTKGKLIFLYLNLEIVLFFPIFVG
jgi:phosphotransferase system HPr-like phosphotransfer protein